MTTHLVWLRNDLRITDNKALHAACSDPKARVLAVFIATPQQWREHEMAPRQAALIHASLRAVQQALAQKGIALHCHAGTDFAASIDWLAEYCRREQVDALFYNRQYELNERRRDARLEQQLNGRVTCHGFDDSLLLPPGSVLTGGGEMYKVYTPFRNAFIQRLTESDVSCLPAPKIRADGALPAPEAPA
ncbi:deoxyribodipyrimidine photo-lyase, partial [Serratia marcescens]|nr:deoxyribodipyrimidine photo-lyase [Serratia marcescens]